MQDYPLFPGLGRSLTDNDVALYLGVEVDLVSSMSWPASTVVLAL